MAEKIALADKTQKLWKLTHEKNEQPNAPNQNTPSL